MRLEIRRSPAQFETVMKFARATKLGYQLRRGMLLLLIISLLVLVSKTRDYMGETAVTTGAWLFSGQKTCSRRAQLEMNAMFKAYHELCQELNLTYFAFGGMLIGAVRNGGHVRSLAGSVC